MKNTKIKFILFLCTLTMLGSITKINAMETNKKNQINLNKSTEQKQENKTFNKKLNNLNLFNLKKNKSFNKKIGELKLNNTKKNEETLYIGNNLEEFEKKFSNYLKDLISLEERLLLINQNNTNFHIKKNLEQIKNNYEQQKQKIEETNNEYNKFLNINLYIISQDKDELTYEILIYEISENINDIENKIKNINTILNNIEQNNKNLNQNKTFNKIVENLDLYDLEKYDVKKENLNKIENNNINLNNKQSSNSYESSIVENLDSDITINEEEKKFVIKKLLDEINSKFVNYYTIYNYTYKFIKILENSVDTTQNLFIDYINSILTKPIETIAILKTKYEKNSNKIKELIKSFDEFKEIFLKNLDAKINFTAKMLNGDKEKIKNLLVNIEKIKCLILDIDKITNNFLIFDNENEKYVYYNFLKRSNQENYDKNNPNIDTAKLNERFYNNVLNSIVEENINFNNFSIFDVLDMPIKSNTMEIAEDEINLMNQNEKIIISNPNNESNQEDIDDLSQNFFSKKFIKEYSKEISKQYENSLKSFINLLKDIENAKKYKDFIDQNRDLISYYKKNNNRINSNIKKNFVNTLNNAENMVQKAIIQYIKTFEANINLQLKTATNNFFNLENKIKENIENNNEQIIPEEEWTKFIKNWDNINHISYGLENLKLNFDEYFKNLEEIKKTKQKINELALILTSVGTKPFVNLLINKLNSNKKNFDSLLFQSQLYAYKSKLENLFSYYINELIKILKSKQWKISPLEHCDKYKKIIKNFYKLFNNFLDRYLEKHNQKTEQNNIEFYEKEPLREKINCFKNIIEKTNEILDQTDAFVYNELNKHNINDINDHLVINFNVMIQNALHDDVTEQIINKIKDNHKLIRNIISNKKDNKNMKKE